MTPPLRTVEAWCWVKGSSLCSRHLQHKASVTDAPGGQRQRHAHLSRDNSSLLASGSWLRLASRGPR